MALVLGVSGASAFAYDYRNGLDRWRVRDEIDSLRAELHQVDVRLHSHSAITITGINSSRLLADEWIR